MPFSERNRNYTNPFWLIREHIHNGRTIKDMAKDCGVSTHTVNRWLLKFGIRTIKKKKRLYTNKNWLYNEYIKKRKTTKTICKEIGCHYYTIIRWLAIHNIKKLSFT